MGHMRHHAIVVTSCNDEVLEAAHAEALRICSAVEESPLSPGLALSVSEITPRVMNKYRSFFVAPDGSKEGWERSNAGDRARNAIISWLEGRRFPDGSSHLDWVEVQFGDDDKQTLVVRDSDHPPALET